jgi:hypothetical protein
MRLGLCEGRSAVAERAVSVESDPETLGRAGCERETTGTIRKVGLLRSDCRIRFCTRGCSYKLSSRKTEGCTRPPTFTRAVTPARSGALMWAALMFRTHVLPGGHPVRMPMTLGCDTVMHGAGDGGNCIPAQRRHPGREKSDENLNGEKATHHATNLSLANRFRFRGSR